MKVFYWYAGILFVSYLALAAYVLMGGRFGQTIDKSNAGWLGTVVGLGFGFVVAAILTGGGVIVLWKKFVMHDASVPTALWIVSALVIISLINPAIQVTKWAIAYAHEKSGAAESSKDQGK